MLFNGKNNPIENTVLFLNMEENVRLLCWSIHSYRLGFWNLKYKSDGLIQLHWQVIVELILCEFLCLYSLSPSQSCFSGRTLTGSALLNTKYLPFLSHPFNSLCVSYFIIIFKCSITIKYQLSSTNDHTSCVHLVCWHAHTCVRYFAFLLWRRVRL